jgi:uncharacterized protein (TIGR00369 family)
MNLPQNTDPALAAAADPTPAINPVLDGLQRKFVERTPHMREIGLTVTALAPGRGAMSLPDRSDWLGDAARGWLHTGPVTVLADSTCGLAVGAALPVRLPYATLDLRMDYLGAAMPGQPVHCEAHCYRLTRSVAFVRGEVWQADRQTPVANVQATFMLSTPAGTHPSSHPAKQPTHDGAPPAPDAEGDAPWLAPTGHAPVLAGSLIPYVEYLRIHLASGGDAPLYCLPFQDKLIGNPYLPALHGGVVAGFAETAATLQLIRSAGGAKLPKCIDFSIDYLRAGRAEATYASCEVVRLGARVALVQVRCWQSKGPTLPIAVARGHFLLTAPGAVSMPAGA